MQAEHPHSPTPQPGVAGRSGNPSPNTHTHTAHPCQKWLGASWARTQPNTAARSGGAHESGHAFVDDLLYRSEDGDRIQQILNFFNTVAREWGLDLNLSKTEIHAMGTAPPRTFTSPSGTPLSTTNQKTGQPHNCYKYLGVYIFTANHEAQTLALAKSEIRSFFTTLQPLWLTLSEYILLVNVQLIPLLSYRLMAHPLALNELGALQAMIW